MHYRCGRAIHEGSRYWQHWIQTSVSDRLPPNTKPKKLLSKRYYGMRSLQNAGGVRSTRFGIRWSTLQT